MSVSGLCQVCGNREGKHTCDHCGTLACGDHWDSAEQACLECAELSEDSEEPSGFEL